MSSARPSRQQDIDDRRRRYVLTMGVRTVLFLLAVFLFHGWARWVAIAFSFVAPYVAVVIANAGPLRHRDTSLYTEPAPGAERMLTDGRVIDGPEARR